MTTYSYLRVSTDLQTVENQRKMIVDAGFAIDAEFSDEGVSGGIAALERKGFSQLMQAVQEGDVVICTMVDRLGRNAADVLKTIEAFKNRNVKLRIMQFDGVDVTSPMGKMIITVMAALAEMEKAILIERTNAGLARVKASGKKLGPPVKCSTPIMKNMVALKAKGWTLDEISKKYYVPIASVARYIKWYNESLTKLVA